MEFLKVVGLLRSAVDSNFFGLGCPFYCAPSSLPSLVLSFLLGVIVGAFGVGYLVIRWWGLRTLVPNLLSEESAAPIHPRLRGYLYASQQ